MDQINSTTFKIAEHGLVKPNITIGGSDPGKFVVNANKSYDLQGASKKELFFININRYDIVTGLEQPVFDQQKDEVTFTLDDNVYDVFTTNAHYFDWSVKYKSKPATNILRWRLTHSAGIRFLYQDTLENDYKANNEGFTTLAEYLANTHRPDDVVGSYAVYCDKEGIALSRKGEVIHAARTGKLTHIYRPVVADALTNWAWCSLDIADETATTKIMTITIPQSFLYSAQYPVTI